MATWTASNDTQSWGAPAATADQGWGASTDDVAPVADDKEAYDPYDAVPDPYDIAAAGVPAADEERKPRLSKKAMEG